MGYLTSRSTSNKALRTSSLCSGDLYPTTYSCRANAVTKQPFWAKGQQLELRNGIFCQAWNWYKSQPDKSCQPTLEPRKNQVMATYSEQTTNFHLGFSILSCLSSLNVSEVNGISINIRLCLHLKRLKDLRKWGEDSLRVRGDWSLLEVGTLLVTGATVWVSHFISTHSSLTPNGVDFQTVDGLSWTGYLNYWFISAVVDTKIGSRSTLYVTWSFSICIF